MRTPAPPTAAESGSASLEVRRVMISSETALEGKEENPQRFATYSWRFTAEIP